MRKGLNSSAEGKGLRKAWLPTDPRYINTSGSHLEIQTDEPVYTVDGEILPVSGEAVDVHIGPTLKLALGPTAIAKSTLRAARSALGA